MLECNRMGNTKKILELNAVDISCIQDRDRRKHIEIVVSVSAVSSMQ